MSQTDWSCPPGPLSSSWTSWACLDPALIKTQMGKCCRLVVGCRNSMGQQSTCIVGDVVYGLSQTTDLFEDKQWCVLSSLGTHKRTRRTGFVFGAVSG